MKQTRGRPRAFDDDQVLDQSVDLFWRNGYRQTTTRDLESALGISQSSLYNAFGSKQQLMEAAMARYEDRVGKELLAPLESGECGLEGIDDFFDSLATVVTSNGKAGCMIINLLADGGEAGTTLARRAGAYRSRIRAALQTALAGAAEAGTAVPGDLAGRTDLLFGVTLGINLLARDPSSRDELAGLVRGAHAVVAGWRA